MNINTGIGWVPTSVPQVLLALSLAAMVLSSGCNDVPPWAVNAPVERRPEYSFEFFNATQRTMTQVRALWHDNGQPRLEGPLTLRPNPIAGFRSNGEPDPIPENIEFSWVTSDGKWHQQTVAVAKRIPDLPHFSGTVYFKFTDAGVEVIPVTYDEQDRRAAEGKGLLP